MVLSSTVRPGPNVCGPKEAQERGSSLRPGIRSYVLRSGRTSAAQKRAYDGLSPRYRVPFSAGFLDYAALFGNSNPVTVEIGFGMGRAAAGIAQANPDRNYLGIEVHKPGIGRLLWEIEKRSLVNIRIVERDAVETLEKMIAGGSTAAFHIFFPDPWPKKRHHKRRLVTRPFTALLAEKLRPGGYIYMATDWEDYARWALAELSATEGLRNPYAACPETALYSEAACPDAACSDAGAPGAVRGEDAAEASPFGITKSNGFAPPQPWRPRTEFEAKGLAKGHKIWELYVVKEQ
ncbi:MAG: tRNA (guanosine(46)-N7)-methyltransferase TrmB [Treponema sp.]|jgi:tRNA (guanine-N7-)-methyltransferase|nr:tRNA (guanosine(46)-N7)-methyltransferase TrmB [Treponema sp.]